MMRSMIGSSPGYAATSSTAESTPSCPVCGGRRAAKWKARNLSRRLEPEDLLITDARYGMTLELWKCSQCTFIFASGDEITELEELYARLDDPEYDAGAPGRELQMEWLLARARAARPGATTLLDVGAASGMLVRAASAAGLVAEGVEPSVSLVERGRAHGSTLHAGVLPHPALSGRTFDIVTLVDIIEHVRDPIALLKQASAHVAPGGILFVVTPDVGSVAARILGPRWWHLRLAHVGYFDDGSFRAACTRAGLAIKKSERAKWFFKTGYLAERVERYLPVGGLNRLARSLPGLSRAYDLVVPLNLFDSTVFVLAADGAREHAA